jgi:hypothetical protein
MNCHHPIWGFAEKLVLLAFLTLWFKLGYVNGFDLSKDGVALLIPLITGGALGAMRVMQDKKNGDE